MFKKNLIQTTYQVHPVINSPLSYQHSNFWRTCDESFNTNWFIPLCIISDPFRLLKLPDVYASTVRRQFICDNCPRVYNTIRALRSHQRIECSREPSCSCNYCSYRTHRRSNLKSTCSATKDELNKRENNFFVKLHSINLGGKTIRVWEKLDLNRSVSRFLVKYHCIR